MARGYTYAVEDCDIPEVRRGRLKAYRVFRANCLDALVGMEPNSVASQIRDLVWHTMVFYSLNKARRLEHPRLVNGAMWELIGAGYASLMTVGIRRLVDTHADSTSLVTVLQHIEKHPEFHTRELFVSYDGIPYDGDEAERRYTETVLREGYGSSIRWLSTTGPNAWATSIMMHKAFDKVASTASPRRRLDALAPHVFTNLKTAFSSPAIQKVRTFTDKVVAHAERIAQGESVPVPQFNDVEEALKALVQVTNFIAVDLFYDGFGSTVPTPQFDVFENLELPWVRQETLPHLHEYWKQRQSEMDAWVNDSSVNFWKKD